MKWSIYIYRVSQKEWKKSNHLVWHKNKVELLFLTHELRGNLHLFCLITKTKTWSQLFWSKLSMQKILRNAKKCHFRPILVKWLFQIANNCNSHTHIALYNLQNNYLSYHVAIWGPFGWLCGIKKAHKRPFDWVKYFAKICLK